MNLRSNTGERKSWRVAGRARLRGFTLFEVLVAVAIFAILGVAANRLLNQVVRVDGSVRERSARLVELQRAMAVIERDALQIVARPVRDELGDPQPALHGGLRELVEFTRSGWRNPTGQPRAQLQRVAYVLEDKQLLRFYWNVLDRAAGATPVRQVLLRDVEDASVEFIDASAQQQSYWPVQDSNATTTEILPRALRWHLRVEPFGDLERLLALPDNLPRRASAGAGGGDAGGDPTPPGASGDAGDAGAAGSASDASGGGLSDTGGAPS